MSQASTPTAPTSITLQHPDGTELGANTGSVTACCAAAAQADCCVAEEKAGCCGAPMASERCGCQA